MFGLNLDVVMVLFTINFDIMAKKDQTPNTPQQDIPGTKQTPVEKDKHQRPPAETPKKDTEKKHDEDKRSNP